MTVSATWVDPSAAGTLDLATGATVTETWVDGVASDLLVLGGTDGKSGGFQMPTGAVLPFAAAAAPTGWLACDGSAVSRTTFARLFGIVGVTWGAGDGSTTFNVPDLRGRTPIGSGAGPGLTARTLAAAGGEENHTLTLAESPAHAHTHNAHNHGVTDPGHGHQLQGTSGNVSSSGAAWPSFIGVTPQGVTTLNATTGVTVNNATTTEVGNQGGGAGHNNMQPFAVLNYIIKA